MNDTNIEQLQTQVDQVKTELDALKAASEESTKKTKEIAEKVKTVREQINTKIENLKRLWEETYKVEIEELEALLTNLESSVDDVQTLKSELKEEKTQEKIVKVKKDNVETNRRSPISRAAIGIGAGTTVGVAANRIVKRATQGEKISETVNVAKTKKSMDRVVTMLKVRLKDTELLDCQKESIKKSITYFEEARDNSHAIEYVQIWKKLGDKLPIETLQKLDITKDTAKKLKLIYQDEELVKQLALVKDETKIKALLKAKSITDIPDDAIKLFKLADRADDVADIAKVLSMTKPIKALAKGLRAVPYLDFVAAGVDIRVFINESKEADLIKKTNEIRGMNKQQQANFHLAMASVDLAVGITAIALTCASCWPPGWIVWVVAAAAAAVTRAVTSVADKYYYEVVDFYTRNKEDYKASYRMEIKEAILTATARGDDSFELSWTEKFAEAFNRSDSIDKNKTVTLEDAYRTMIYLEEKENFPIVTSLNPEYPKEPEKALDGDELTRYTADKTELDKVIVLRMSYIKKYLPHTTTSADKIAYDAFLNAIRWAKGIAAIEQIVQDSKTYQKMKQDTEFAWYSDIKEYQDAKLTALNATNQQWYENIDAMYKEDPMKVTELYYNVINFDFAVKDADSYKETYQELLPKITFIKTYYECKLATLPIEKRLSLWTITDISYVQVEEMLKNMDANGIVGLKPTIFTEDLIKTRMVSGLELDRFEESYSEYTSSIGQNVVYRIAKEIYGYDGKNDVISMMVYFNPEKNESLGMYFDDGRYINIVNGGDNKITFKDIETKTASELMNEYIQHAADDNLDTSVENMDEEMNKEFKDRVRTIIEEEKSFQDWTKKEKVKKEIVEYIKKNATEGYVKLSYDLVNDAKRAGIGNVEYFFYTYKDDSIVACTAKAYVDEKIDLWKNVKITKSYVENVRTEFSKDEKLYISYVEDAYKRLMELRKVKGTMTQEDELDLPEEFERTIGDKYKQRQNFKESLLGYSPERASDQLLKTYETYRAYFENIYMGILIEVSSHKFTNDVDGYQYIMSALSQADSWFFDFENEKMTEGVLSESETKRFFEFIKTKKVFGKTIIELVKSNNDEEKAKWYRAAKQVLKAILETKTVRMDDKFQIEDVYSWKYNINPFAGISESFEQMQGLFVLSKLIDHNLNESNYIDAAHDIDTTNIAAKTDEQVKIKILTKEEQAAYDESVAVLKKIQDTADNVVRQDQRGNITFDSENKTIESRWSKVKIDIEKMKISWLDIVFPNIKELLYMANLINRFNWKIFIENPWHKGILFFWSDSWTLYANDGYIGNARNDTDLISSDAIKQKYPTLLSESNKKAFLEYMN